MLDRPLVGPHGLRRPVDLDDPFSGVQDYVIVNIPFERVHEDIGRILDPAQDVRQQDAVVVAIGLVAKHHYVEHIGATACQDFLDGACTGHAIADHHKFLFHDAAPADGLRFRPLRDRNRL